AVAPEIIEMAALFFLRREEQLDTLFERGDGARLMVHDFLDFPAIRQKRIEPDLPGLESVRRFFRCCRARARVDACGSDAIENGEVVVVFNKERSGTALAGKRDAHSKAVGKIRVRSLADPFVPRRSWTVVSFQS